MTDAVTIRPIKPYNVGRVSFILLLQLTAYFTYTSNPETDRFTFSLFLPEWFGVGSEMEFAVCYQARDASTSYWDNNSGDNYRVKCLTRSSYSLPSGCETGGVLTLPWQQLI